MKTKNIFNHNLDNQDFFNWNTADANRLVKALLISAKNPDTLRIFIDDLLTKSEIKLCVTRLHAVNLIILGMPYTSIVQLTGLSSTTIARISKQICNKKGGYYNTIQKMYPHGIRYFD